MALTPQEIEQLEDLLFDPRLEDAHDFFGLHGLVCASIVGPVELDTKQIISITCSENEHLIDSKQIEHLQYCIEEIRGNIREALSEGVEANLPYESEDDIEPCVESWCIGFIEGFFANENEWFEKDQDVAAELLLPMMTLSGLFESEEFEEIRANDKLMSQFEAIIADQLTDIYLFYHSS